MYIPQSYQTTFHQSPARFKNIVGGVRSGKTYSATREFYKRILLDLKRKLKRCEGKEFLHYWLVTPNFPIGKVVQREMFATLQDFDPRHVKRWKKSVKELYLYPNILLEFKTAHDPKVLVATKLHGLLVDEMARMKSEAWQGGLRQRLTDERGWGVFCTSPMGKNWYFKEIVRRGIKEDELYDIEFANFKFLTEQNKYIPPGELEAAKRQLPPRYYRREYQASFEDFFGQILEEFDRSVHKYPRSSSILARLQLPEVRKPERFAKIIAGIDWGYSTPGCIMVFGKTDEELPRYFELETVYKEHMLVSNPSANQTDTWLGHALRLKEKYGNLSFYPGKDEPEHIETFRRYGLFMCETDYEVNPGIQTLNKLTHIDENGDTRLFFSRNIQEIVMEEWETYQWKQNQSGDDMEAPVKEKDHSLDSARYALHAEEKVGDFASAVIAPDPNWYDPSTYMENIL